MGSSVCVVGRAYKTFILIGFSFGKSSLYNRIEAKTTIQLTIGDCKFATLWLDIRKQFASLFGINK